MAFQGYYVKVGDFTIPLLYMRLESYKSMPDQRQTLDAYRDADGYMHQNGLPHTVTKIEFETPYMVNSDMQDLIQGIRRNYINVTERRVNLTYYDDSIDDYKSGVFYLPGTIEYVRYNKEIYAPTRFAFIEL